MSDRPNPGSVEAREAGCTCPVLDNNGGRHPPIPLGDDGQGAWYIWLDCPVHGADYDDKGE